MPIWVLPTAGSSADITIATAGGTRTQTWYYTRPNRTA